MKRLAVSLLVTVAAVGLVSAQSNSRPASSPRSTEAGARASIPYDEVQPILEILRDELIPEALRRLAPSAREAVWPAWAARRDQETRARVERGEEDSVANLLLFGGSFTTLPRLTSRHIAELGGPSSAGAARLVLGRIEDLAAAIAQPGADEHVRFASEVVARKGIDSATPEGHQQARRLLLEVMTRVAAESDAQDQVLQSAPPGDPGTGYASRATVFRDRGLSSDSSIFPSFAVDRALHLMRDAGTFGGRVVRRVGIVGPGLDVIDKGEGFDFYPPPLPAKTTFASLRST
jgi:hypothetical protein